MTKEELKILLFYLGITTATIGWLYIRTGGNI